MAPALVDETNTEEVFERLYGARRPADGKVKFKPGDQVRASKLKGPFRKGFEINWSEEVFTVKEVKRGEVPRYILQDYDGETISGSFYAFELMSANLPPGEEREYVVESILKRRTRNRVKEVFVHYRGYPKSQDRWMKESDLRQL